MDWGFFMLIVFTQKRKESKDAKAGMRLVFVSLVSLPENTLRLHPLPSFREPLCVFLP